MESYHKNVCHESTPRKRMSKTFYDYSVIAIINPNMYGRCKCNQHMNEKSIRLSGRVAYTRNVIPYLWWITEIVSTEKKSISSNFSFCLFLLKNISFCFGTVLTSTRFSSINKEINFFFQRKQKLLRRKFYFSLLSSASHCHVAKINWSQFVPHCKIAIAFGSLSHQFRKLSWKKIFVWRFFFVAFTSIANFDTPLEHYLLCQVNIWTNVYECMRTIMVHGNQRMQTCSMYAPHWSSHAW